MFDLIQNQLDFLEYLNANSLKFKSLKMLTVNYSEKQDEGRLFTFETICKMLIDDGDSVWRKKRSSLLDPNMKSLLMIVDRKSNIMYILLFGEKLQSRELASPTNDQKGEERKERPEPSSNEAESEKYDNFNESQVSNDPFNDINKSQKSKKTDSQGGLFNQLNNMQIGGQNVQDRKNNETAPLA